MDPSDSLPALHDFSHPALYAQSLPDVGCRVGPLLFRTPLSKLATAPTPERSNRRSGTSLLSVALIRRDMTGSALSNAFRLIL